MQVCSLHSSGGKNHKPCPPGTQWAGPHSHSHDHLQLHKTLQAERTQQKHSTHTWHAMSEWCIDTKFFCQQRLYFLDTDIWAKLSNCGHHVVSFSFPDGVVWGSLQKESTSSTFQSIHQAELSPLIWAIKLCLIAHTSPPTLFALYRQQFSLPWTKAQNGTLPSSTLTYLPLWVPNIYSQHHSMIFGSQKQAHKEQSFLTLQLTRLHA